MSNYKKLIDKKRINQVEINWDFNKEPQITESIINYLVIGEDKKVYIPYSKLKNINVESGGSPFTYTYNYNNYQNRWYVDKYSKGSYYLGEDEDNFTFEELFDFITRNMNWKNIGNDIDSICRKRWNSKFSSKFYNPKELLIDWEWVLFQIDNLTKSDVEIIFSDDDINIISSISY